MENENERKQPVSPAPSVSAQGNLTAIVVAVITSLLIGGIGGYSLKATPAPDKMAPDSSWSETKGSHRMPDGTMMSGSDMTMAMDGMTDRLEMESRGDSFDKAFLEEMIVHHEGAVDMAELVLEKSDRPELRKLAEEIIAAQTKEIGDMKGWLGTWYK
jgi:hypothetical protein